jgi:hypothetical protein
MTESISTPPLSFRNVCSFCQRDAKLYRAILTSNGVCICDSCTVLAVEAMFANLAVVQRQPVSDLEVADLKRQLADAQEELTRLKNDIVLLVMKGTNDR